MEGNRDEASRCIEIAIKSLAEGKIEKAEKFLLKAENLFPTQKGKELLEKLKTKSFGGDGGGSKMPGSPGARRRTTAASGATTGTANKPEDVKHEPEYTPEQVEIVKKVKKCKNYYEVLGVTKESTDSDIKKAYKKLALQLHPDKNQAPGAIEAFKAVGNAVAVLTDPNKRKRYDLCGDEQRNNGHGGFDGDDRRADDFFRAHTFESDISAEDMFNFFFGGGGMAGGGGGLYQQNVFMRQRRYRAQNQQRDQQNGGYAALFNLLPIILLIMLSMMSSFFISDPIYNLTPSQKYSVARKTNGLKIPYYVKDNFHSEYQGSVGRLEASVEEEYINNLKHACFRERNYRETMLMKARNFGDRELFRKAQNINTPSCDNLHNLQSQRS